MVRILVDEGTSKRFFDISNFNDQITVGKILEKANVDMRAWSEVWLDGEKVSISDSLSDVTLLEGSVLSCSSEKSVPVDTWQVIHSGGLNLGSVYELPPGSLLRVGRSPEADITVDSPSVSWSHCVFNREAEGVRVRDVGSSNGTYVDGIKIEDEDGILVKDYASVSVGGATLLLCSSLDEDLAPRPGSLNNVTPTHTVPFNRPPRMVLPKRPDSLDLPIKKDSQKPSKFSWITVAAPLVMAIAMVAVMGSVRYALIAILSPVMAVGSWWEQKQRAKKSEKEENEKYNLALDNFAKEIKAAAILERKFLRAKIPNPAVCKFRATLPSTRLWQRRPDDEDFWSLHLGVADIPFAVPLSQTSSSGKKEKRVAKLLSSALIESAPVEVDLSQGVVGIWGERNECVSVARSLLCQLVTHIGPADMSVGVFCDRSRSSLWQWTALLPHLRQPGANADNLWLGMDNESSQQILRVLRDALPSLPTPGLVLLLDSQSLTEGRDCPARDILTYREDEFSASRKTGRKVSGIVIAATPDQLPAVCSTVIHAKTDALATLSLPGAGKRQNDITVAGISDEFALDWARSLARFDDPETKNLGATLPSLTHLLPLLGLSELDGSKVCELWRTNHGYSAPLGVSEDGVFWFDLVRDGPHGLVGGTTGSGKSELLRSLVAGLAARVDPEHLTFILVDFKGGAAFASCNQLPHTIGTISNLEAQLANRALRALEAEMLYRQQKFAQAGEGVDNLDAYLATNPDEPMPRLLLVIDEFAQLAKDYPDVLSALVSIGAVGRTLGVHMILATQRPAGVVNDDILANTNMRVALRVQSRDDSSNVISVPHASAIGRDQRGRAYVKLGEEDINPIQTALVTGRCLADDSADFSVLEATLGFPSPKPELPKRKSSDPDDLDRLIEAICQANEISGFAPPRPVWPEPLGQKVILCLSEQESHASYDVPKVIPERGERLLVSVVDDPSNQRQFLSGWDLSEGNLLLLGIPGSGTTTTLMSLGLSAAYTHSPDELDILVLDLGSRELECLKELPHTSAYVAGGSSERELQERFLRFLKSEFDRRRANPGVHRKMLVLLDGLATLRDEFSEYDAMILLESFYQVWSGGPDLGIHIAASSTRAKSIPSQIEDVTTQRWFFRLADAYDYAAAGVGRDDVPPPVPGRCVEAVSGLQAHVATPDFSVSQAITGLQERYSQFTQKDPVVAPLPEFVLPSDLSVLSQVGIEPWRIPVGIAESSLEPCFLDVFEGEHMLIAGPARSGKSTCAAGIARKLLADSRVSGVPLQVWAVAGRRSPLLSEDFDQVVSHGDIAGILALAGVVDSPTLLIIDDAEQLDDSDRALATLLDRPNPNLLVIAVGRNDDLRAYGHWTSKVRRSKCGLLLRPNVDFDGDMLGVTIPRNPPVKMSVARGYACHSGVRQLVQAVTTYDPERG
ncbi:FHA domain-containing protein [Actinomycetaceae bacterium TAE3-ERU4]|nr:FHA domain-containing protein [Actinomycetaceae bacterium TAE3-ERU4]